MDQKGRTPSKAAKAAAAAAAAGDQTPPPTRTQRTAKAAAAAAAGGQTPPPAKTPPRVAKADVNDMQKDAIVDSRQTPLLNFDDVDSPAVTSQPDASAAAAAATTTTAAGNPAAAATALATPRPNKKPRSEALTEKGGENDEDDDNPKLSERMEAVTITDLRNQLAAVQKALAKSQNEVIRLREELSAEQKKTSELARVRTQLKKQFGDDVQAPSRAAVEEVPDDDPDSAAGSVIRRNDNKSDMVAVRGGEDLDDLLQAVVERDVECKENERKLRQTVSKLYSLFGIPDSGGREKENLSAIEAILDEFKLIYSSVNTVFENSWRTASDQTAKTVSNQWNIHEKIDWLVGEHSHLEQMYDQFLELIRILERNEPPADSYAAAVPVAKDGTVPSSSTALVLSSMEDGKPTTTTTTTDQKAAVTSTAVALRPDSLVLKKAKEIRRNRRIKIDEDIKTEELKSATLLVSLAATVVDELETYENDRTTPKNLRGSTNMAKIATLAHQSYDLEKKIHELAGDITSYATRVPVQGTDEQYALIRKTVESCASTDKRHREAIASLHSEIKGVYDVLIAPNHRETSPTLQLGAIRSKATELATVVVGLKLQIDSLTKQLDAEKKREADALARQQQLTLQLAEVSAKRGGDSDPGSQLLIANLQTQLAATAKDWEAKTAGVEKLKADLTAASQTLKESEAKAAAGETQLNADLKNARDSLTMFRGLAGRLSRFDADIDQLIAPLFKAFAGQSPLINDELNKTFGPNAVIPNFLRALIKFEAIYSKRTNVVTKALTELADVKNIDALRALDSKIQSLVGKVDDDRLFQEGRIHLLQNLKEVEEDLASARKRRDAEYDLQIRGGNLKEVADLRAKLARAEEKPAGVLKQKLETYLAQNVSLRLFAAEVMRYAKAVTDSRDLIFRTLKFEGGLLLDNIALGAVGRDVAVRGTALNVLRFEDALTALTMYFAQTAGAAYWKAHEKAIATRVDLQKQIDGLINQKRTPDSKNPKMVNDSLTPAQIDREIATLRVKQQSAMTAAVSINIPLDLSSVFSGIQASLVNKMILSYQLPGSRTVTDSMRAEQMSHLQRINALYAQNEAKDWVLGEMASAVEVDLNDVDGNLIREKLEKSNDTLSTAVARLDRVEVKLAAKQVELTEKQRVCEQKVSDMTEVTRQQSEALKAFRVYTDYLKTGLRSVAAKLGPTAATSGGVDVKQASDAVGKLLAEDGKEKAITDAVELANRLRTTRDVEQSKIEEMSAKGLLEKITLENQLREQKVRAEYENCKRELALLEPRFEATEKRVVELTLYNEYYSSLLSSVLPDVKADAIKAANNGFVEQNMDRFKNQSVPSEMYIVDSKDWERKVDEELKKRTLFDRKLDVKYQDGVANARFLLEDLKLRTTRAVESMRDDFKHRTEQLKQQYKDELDRCKLLGQADKELQKVKIQLEAARAHAARLVVMIMRGDELRLRLNETYIALGDEKSPPHAPGATPAAGIRPAAAATPAEDERLDIYQKEWKKVYEFWVELTQTAASVALGEKDTYATVTTSQYATMSTFNTTIRKMYEKLMVADQKRTDYTKANLSRLIVELGTIFAVRVSSLWSRDDVRARVSELMRTILSAFAPVASSADSKADTTWIGRSVVEFETGLLKLSITNPQVPYDTFNAELSTTVDKFFPSIHDAVLSEKDYLTIETLIAKERKSAFQASTDKAAESSCQKQLVEMAKRVKLVDDALLIIAKESPALAAGLNRGEVPDPKVVTTFIRKLQSDAARGKPDAKAVALSEVGRPISYIFSQADNPYEALVMFMTRVAGEAGENMYSLMRRDALKSDENSDSDLAARSNALARLEMMKPVVGADMKSAPGALDEQVSGAPDPSSLQGKIDEATRNSDPKVFTHNTHIFLTPAGYSALHKMYEMLRRNRTGVYAKAPLLVMINSPTLIGNFASLVACSYKLATLQAGGRNETNPELRMQMLVKNYNSASKWLNTSIRRIHTLYPGNLPNGKPDYTQTAWWQTDWWEDMSSNFA